MWQIVERAEIAAPPRLVWTIVSDVARHAEIAGSGELRGVRIDGPVAVGTEFESDVRVAEVGEFVSRNRIDVVDEPTEFAWTSYPPLDDGQTADHQVEVHWWFRLAPSWTGTALEHGVRVPPPHAGADALAECLDCTDRLAAVRRGMVATMTAVKRRAEVSAR